MKLRTLVLAFAAIGLTAAVVAQQAVQRPGPVAAQAAPSLKAAEASIRKNLAARLRELPKIDEVRSTPIAGLYEVRMGNEVVYADANADYVIQGDIIDVKKGQNLTQERMEKLSQVDFKKLPLKDAFKIVRGNGQRQLAVFEDPNCGYCKKFEADLQQINNVTVHVFLLPILGADSQEKSKNIWCSKNRVGTWQAWMLNNQVPPQVNCDTSALDRNVAFAQKNRIQGTPAIIFSDGTRVPGAVPAAQIEAILKAQAR